jgi:hypothetical protein
VSEKKKNRQETIDIRQEKRREEKTRDKGGRQ